MKYIFLLTLFAASSSWAQEQGFFCTSASPSGAIVLYLNTQGPSIGRMSTPFSRDYRAMIPKNADSSSYNPLQVGFVAPLQGEEGWSFNATPYQLGNDKSVLDQTKSFLRKAKTAGPGKYELQFMIEFERYMIMQCEKI